jgi:Uma2 family endonuclease
MGASTLVPVEEYLSTSYDPDCDYVDGELEDRNVGRKSHAKAQSNLLLALRIHYPSLFVVVEQRTRVSATRYRIPDVCAMLAEPDEEVFTEPPFLCIEVLSPDDRASRIERKIADYLKFGVRYIWVIDPRTREAFIHTATGMRAVEDGVLRTSDPDIAVPLAEILGQTDFNNRWRDIMDAWAPQRLFQLRNTCPPPMIRTAITWMGNWKIATWARRITASSR